MRHDAANQMDWQATCALRHSLRACNARRCGCKPRILQSEPCGTAKRSEAVKAVRAAHTRTSVSGIDLRKSLFRVGPRPLTSGGSLTLTGFFPAVGIANRRRAEHSGRAQSYQRRTRPRGACYRVATLRCTAGLGLLRCAWIGPGGNPVCRWMPWSCAALSFGIARAANTRCGCE